jgi:LacI family transcriptional regulator
MRITIKDIAAQLGISAATVSRALKDDPRITKEIKAKVVKLSDELGYRPNLLARGLVSNRTFTIGFMVDNLSWSYFSELAEFVQVAAEKYGYSALIYSSLKSSAKEKHGIESFLSRGIDGLLIYMTEFRDNYEVLNDLAKRNFPIVIYNDLPDLPLDAVVTDFYAGAMKVMDYLFDNGHRNIHYIGASDGYSANKARIAAFRKSYEIRSLTLPEAYIHTEGSDPLYGYRVAKTMLGKDNRPTAIFVHNDTMALGVYRAVYELGLTIPNDISIVGSDDLELAHFVHPPLTTVGIPIKQLAEIGVDLLIKRINEVIKHGSDIDIVHQKIVLEPKLIIRDSTASLKAADID